MDFDLGVGETFAFDRYVFRVENLSFDRNPNYQSQRATVALFEKARASDADASARQVATMRPEKRLYLHSNTPTTEVAIRSTVTEDVYLVFQESAADGAKARLKAYFNPLVMWVWNGGIVLAFGTLVALLPNRKTLPGKRPAREQKAEEVSKEGSEVETVSR
jgi:cytochrome c-type biogenesis protein CcmF